MKSTKFATLIAVALLSGCAIVPPTAEELERQRIREAKFELGRLQDQKARDIQNARRDQR